MNNVQQAAPQPQLMMSYQRLRQLRENLLAGLRQNDMGRIDTTLLEIEAACVRCEYEYFILPIQEGSEWHRTIARRAEQLGVRTVYRWDPHWVSEQTVQAALPTEELRALWLPLQAALDQPARLPLDRAVRDLVMTLRARGFVSVTLPLEEGSVPSGQVVKAWLRVRRRGDFFRFRFRPNELEK